MEQDTTNNAQDTTTGQDTETTETTTQQETEQQTATQQTTAQGEERTYTKAQVDAMINNRLAKVKKGMPTDAELQAYREWQASQQTEAEKQAALQQQLQDAQARAAEAEERTACLAAGVKPDSVADAMALARIQVSDDVDFEDALNQVLTKYPSFRASQVAVTTATRTEQVDKTAADEARVRQIMGLPPKK